MAGESKLEKQVTDWAKSHGILTYKFVSPGRSGVPDRIFLYKGEVAFIELKDDGEKPSALQCHELGQITKANISNIWTDNFETAIDFLSLHLLDQHA